MANFGDPQQLLRFYENEGYDIPRSNGSVLDLSVEGTIGVVLQSLISLGSTRSEASAIVNFLVQAARGSSISEKRALRSTSLPPPPPTSESESSAKER